MKMDKKESTATGLLTFAPRQKSSTVTEDQMQLYQLGDMTKGSPASNLIRAAIQKRQDNSVNRK